MAQTYLGIDYGDMRVGLALVPPGSHRAAPLMTLDGRATDLADRLRAVCLDNGVTTLVMGLPRGLDGQTTQQTRRVEAVAARWQDELGLPVVFQDEAVTSELARERLLSRGESLENGAIDREAAAIILQDHLDGLAR